MHLAEMLLSFYEQVELDDEESSRPGLLAFKFRDGSELPNLFSLAPDLEESSLPDNSCAVLKLPEVSDNPIIDACMALNLLMIKEEKPSIEVICLLVEGWQAPDDGSGRTPSERREQGDPLVKTVLLASYFDKSGHTDWYSLEEVDDSGVKSFSRTENVKTELMSDKAKLFADLANLLLKNHE